MGSTAATRADTPIKQFIYGPWGKYLTWLALGIAGAVGQWSVKWWFEDIAKWGWQLLALVSALCLAWWGIWRDQKADARKAVHSENLERQVQRADTAARIETYKDLLDPLSTLHQAIGDLLGEADYQVGLQRFRIAVVSCAAQLMPEAGHRACFYSVDESDGSHEGEPVTGATELNEQGVLVLAAFRGRSDEPRANFVGANPDGENPHGQRFLEIALHHGGPACFSTIDAGDETIRPRPDSVYKSFMVVPVRKGRRSFGALSIDCETQVDYDDRHRKIGSSLALLLAVAEDRATRRSRHRGADAALKLAAQQLLQERRQFAGRSLGVASRHVDDQVEP